MRRFLVVLTLGLFAATGMAQQVPMGDWRLHPSFLDTRLIESGKDYVYAASSRGFFRVNLQNADWERLSNMNGFHGREISCLTFNPERNVMVIGYADGFIDLLSQEKTITPVPGFYNKLLQGDKRIIHVSFEGKFAYVSTEFGILVIDVEKAEIKDSYTSIGPGGTTQAVYSTTISGDSIYAGLADGLIAAKYSNTVNLNDFSNWNRVYTGRVALQTTWFNNAVWFYTDTVLLKYQAGAVTSVSTGPNTPLRKLQVHNNELMVFRPKGIVAIQSNGSQSTTTVNVLQSGTVDAQGFRWFCTGFGGGALKLTPQGEATFEPNGPNNNSVFAMSKSGNNLYTTAGGLTITFGNAFNPAGFYIYSDYRWVSNPATPFNNGMYDFTFVTYNPVTNKTYLGSQNNGILEMNGTKGTNRFDDNNSPLTRDAGTGFIRLSGMVADDKGNLWVTNYGASNPLLMMDRSNNWTVVGDFDEPFVKNITIDNNGYKWMILQNGGVLVFNDNKTPTNPLDDRTIKLTTNNGLITNEVLSLAADQNGYVWIGTSQGLNVVTNTFEVFTKPRIDRFVIDQDGDLGYLLGEESINDICVDGGNRKWFATNNGVFLAEPNGQEVLANYTVANSPLPDNKVYCIGQLSESGEVFFGTDAGIASYRSDASEASSSFKEIRIYPNPVRPGYSGLITIDGLAQNAEIRITDAAGYLIYQTKANGGTATWPGTRLDGTKPNSGVLYVFGINEDGTETSMGKFVYIRE